MTWLSAAHHLLSTPHASTAHTPQHAIALRCSRYRPQCSPLPLPRYAARDIRLTSYYHQRYRLQRRRLRIDIALHISLSPEPYLSTLRGADGLKCQCHDTHSWHWYAEMPMLRRARLRRRLSDDELQTHCRRRRRISVIFRAAIR